jgi:hypothetical protein
MNVTDFLRSLEKQGLRKTVVFLRTHFDQI